MRKTISILTGLLAVQLVLAIGLNLSHKGLQPQATDVALLKVKDSDVKQITFTGDNDKKVVLQRSGDDWVLPGSDNFPADNDQVNALLKRILTLKHGPAVADTDGAAKRFKVKEDDFERRITLSNGDKTLATLYLGSSASMHQTHMRLADENNVYLVNLPAYEVAVKPEHWQNHNLLQVAATKIESVTTPDVELKRVETAAAPTPTKDDKGADATPATPAPIPSWQVTPLPPKDQISSNGVQAVVDHLAHLRVSKLLGKDAKPDYGLDKPALQITVDVKDGSPVTYALAKMKDGDDYVVKSSLRPEYFSMSAASATAMIDAFKPDKLVQPIPASTANTDDKKPAPDKTDPKATPEHV